MLTPNIDIRIKNEAGKIMFFDYVVEGEIISTWQELTNTAKFTLPRKVSQLNDKITELIQVGNEVVIRLGHDGDFVEEFKGYVTDIGGKIPVEIQCQDLMWKLKQTEASESFRKTKLETVLKKILPSAVQFEADNMDLGDLRLSKVSVASVLEKLKEQYGIVSFVRQGKLIVGTPYNESWRGNDAYKVHYHFQKNIIDNDLTFKNKKDVKVKIECISIQSNGTVQKFVYPNKEAEGELHTLHANNNLSQSELKKFAEEQYNKFLYTGFRGTFLTFGSPYCDHGYIAELEDDFYPEKKGAYLIDKVAVRFGRNGYKRELTLGGKV